MKSSEREWATAMKKPVLEDFSLTAKEYEWVKAHPLPWEFQSTLLCIAISSLVGAMIYINSKDVEGTLGLGFLTFIIVAIVSHYLRLRLIFYHPLYTKFMQYEIAFENYQQSLVEYWKSLTGVVLEDKLRRLYKRLGYDVETTPVSGDKGIDLILNKDDKTTIVQCKGHKKPVGPSVVRELYGTLIDHKYLTDNAILACPAGFTRGAKEFALGKPIQLISATDLIEMAESSGNH